MTNPLRLFLIEDDDDIALLIRKSLERAGHHVSRCRTAADALIVLSQSTFDLVLLDQRLPDMAGLELLQTLTREGIAAPALMVTAYGDEELATRVLRAGALDYLVKDHALTFLAELPKRVTESITRHRLQHTNSLLIQALESARDGIMITDLQGVILHVNRALEHLTGYGRQELIGQNPRLLKSNVHPPALYVEMWRTVLARGSWQGELTNRRKDGTLFQTSLTISPIVDDHGRLTHFVGIQRDITEHKQLERQLLQAQKMQSIGTLAGGVAHEFNNLLAGINGYASLGLREKGLTPTLAEFLQHVVDLSERAAVLTRQLLAFARKPALSRQVTGMPELVRRTGELVRRTLQREVRLEVAETGVDGQPLAVRADGNQLQQALVNLALNARDAMDDREAAALSPENGARGAVVFRVRHAPLDAEYPSFPQHVPPGDYVALEVEDSGAGMAPDVLAQSVDPFFTTKEVGRGTGLGLPMVFGIVQGHQGYLTIDSAPNRGTRVGLFLPRLIEALETTRPTAQILGSEELEPESLPGQSILVIDDEEVVLDVVRRFLQIAGHRVTCVSRGHEALDQLAAGRAVDLIILDLMMPREDAATTFQRLRQRRPGVPVLLCTGLPQADPAPELLRHEGVGIIRKPFRMNELWYAVRQALSQPVASSQ
jgi:two-component system, cell cycle sensor histidine kinase and response regulator CckA